MAPTYPWDVFDPQTSPAPGVQPTSPAPEAFLQAARAANPPPTPAQAESAILAGAQQRLRSEMPVTAPTSYDPLAGLGRYSGPDITPPATPGGPAGPVNPFAGYTPQQLASPVTVGGGSSTVTRINPGTPVNPELEQGLGKTYAAEKEAHQAAAVAAAASADQRQAAALLHRGRMTELQAKHDEQRARILAKVEEHDQEAAKIRQRIKEQQIDPDRFWNSRSPFQIIAMVLATGFAAVGQALRGHSPDVLGMINGFVDRDLAAQKAALDKSQGDLANVKGAISDLYKQSASEDDYFNQKRLIQLDDLKTRFATIAANAQSDELRQRAEMGAVAADRAMLEGKYRRWIGAQPKKQITTSSSSRRVPLYQILQSQQKALAKGEKLEPMDKKLRTKIATLNGMRRDLVDFYHDYKKLGLPAGATEWWGGKGAAVRELGNRILDRYVAAVVPGGGSTEHLRLFKGLLGGKYATDEDVRLRLGMIAQEADNVSRTMFETEADAGVDVRPYLIRDKKYSNLVRSAIQRR